MNKLAQKYLRSSQIPTKACQGCAIGSIENWLLQVIDDLELKQEDVIFGTGIGCVGRQTFATWGGIISVPPTGERWRWPPASR
jgi:2-oxoglutarate ferredoxin oxidoreductase subunit beta